MELKHTCVNDEIVLESKLNYLNLFFSFNLKIELKNESSKFFFEEYALVASK